MSSPKQGLKKGNLATEITPIRRQYLQIKDRFQEAIVLFRLGDFYETFDEDARIVSRELQIALTSREMGKGYRVPLAGIPYHALDGYLARLVQAGYRVAICEQLSGTSSSPGLVARDVVRVVTPGTVVEPALLQERANNFLAAVVLGENEAGLAYADITTAEFVTTQVSLDELSTELDRLNPAELLGLQTPSSFGGRPVTPVATTILDATDARDALLAHFGTLSLEAFGCDDLPFATHAAAIIVAYLEETQKGALKQLTSLRTYSTHRFMALDAQTRRNLELFQSGRFGVGQSLLGVLDHTRTPMGGRALRSWLGQPLMDLKQLERRQDVVDWFNRSAVLREEVARCLREISDLERLINRVRAAIATPREVVALRLSLEQVPTLRDVLKTPEALVVGLQQDDPARMGINWLLAGLKPCPEVVELVANALVEEPALLPGEGGVIREGFSPDLDEVRATSHDTRGFLVELERKERIRTGINSLKVGYNRIFGYYLEVSKTNLTRVPSDYIRRQTLVGGERFITPELKDYEAQILGAGEHIDQLENELFRRICVQIGDQARDILETAAALAQVDALLSLGEVAFRRDYVRPTLENSDVLKIREGRHPVVESVLAQGSFIPNDISLGGDGPTLSLLTGPNMSGKSTYIRQVALITLMAQIGSFVPAKEATIGIVDRIFTRIGLQDDLTMGQSTFMVEMLETAAILNHATASSLVILDEIGRGTSTYDGLAIAQAVAEYLHSHPQLGCKTLFATHYHELTELATRLPHAANFNVAVAEEGGEVIFLHRIVPGAADRSYGVHVAQLSGMPHPVVARAWELLGELEGSINKSGSGRSGTDSHSQLRRSRGNRMEREYQIPLLESSASAVLKELESLDIPSMTPLAALIRLYEFQQQARETPGL
jgi:DNA mismatch repair protein MutS